MKCKKPLILPVILHNLQGYDAHLFIKQLSKVEGELTCIPTTEEKYISFSKKIKVDEYVSRKTWKKVNLNFELRFIDSFKFLQPGLRKLVGNLELKVLRIQKTYLKVIPNFLLVKKFIRTTMFRQLINLMKLSFRQNQSSFQK